MADIIINGEKIENLNELRNNLQNKINEENRERRIFMQNGLCSSNVSFFGKDFVSVHWQDEDGFKHRKDFKVQDALLFIIDDVTTRIDKFACSRDCYFLNCRSEEVNSRGIEIEPHEWHTKFYKWIIDMYKRREKERTDEDVEKSEETKMNEIREIFEVVIRSDVALILFEIEAAKRIYGNKLSKQNKRDFYAVMKAMEKELKNEIMKYIDDKDEAKEHLYIELSAFVRSNSGINKIAKATFNSDEGVMDQDVISMFESLLGKHDTAEYVRYMPETVIDRDDVVKYLTKRDDIISEKELKEVVDSDNAYIVYSECENPNLLKFLTSKQLFKLYEKGKIGDNEIIKNVKLIDLLTGAISVDDKMKILTSKGNIRAYNQSETDTIWECFEKDYFSNEQMKILEQLRYFHINGVIRNYIGNQDRKIATKIGALPEVSKEKMCMIMTPEIVLRELRKGIPEELVPFYNNDLKQVYKDVLTENLEKSVIEFMKKDYSEEDKSSDDFVEESLNLYDKGFLSLDVIAQQVKTSENQADKYLKEHGYNETSIIDFFNTNLISQEYTQDYIIETYGDKFEDKMFDLIDKGMSSRVIKGMYSTKQLLDHARYGMLSAENLAELRDDIKTGLEGNEGETSILSLYLSDGISYKELEMFKNNGVITPEEFESIEDKYNIDEALKKIKENGLVSKKIYENQPNYDYKPPIYPRPIVPPAKSKGNGIDRSLIIHFYEALGISTDDFSVVNSEKCPIFDGYILIPDKKRRLCYLEGEEGTRTYIVPLKYVIEQIEHPGSEDDVIGNSQSRADFAKKIQKMGESANHTKNWGDNMIDKIASVSSKMSNEDKNKFKEQYGYIIKAIAESYKERAKKQL